jgi:hypothetical protein
MLCSILAVTAHSTVRTESSLAAAKQLMHPKNPSWSILLAGFISTLISGQRTVQST